MPFSTYIDVDKQREQFEAVRGNGYPDHVIESLFERDDSGFYVLPDVSNQFSGWQMREAEVQAFRERLGSLLVETDQITRFDESTDLIEAADRALM